MSRKPYIIALFLALSLSFVLSSCGHKGKLKTPAQIEKDAAKSEDKAEKNARKNAENNSQQPPTTFESQEAE